MLPHWGKDIGKDNGKDILMITKWWGKKKKKVMLEIKLALATSPCHKCQLQIQTGCRTRKQL